MITLKVSGCLKQCSLMVIPSDPFLCRWNAQKDDWTYYVETEVSGHSKCLGFVLALKGLTSLLHHVVVIRPIYLRDRMKATWEESQEWEEEEKGIDMSFDLETPLEGIATG